MGIGLPVCGLCSGKSARVVHISHTFSKFALSIFIHETSIHTSSSSRLPTQVMGRLYEANKFIIRLITSDVVSRMSFTDDKQPLC
jgi:hypothetical protein